MHWRDPRAHKHYIHASIGVCSVQPTLSWNAAAAGDDAPVAGVDDAIVVDVAFQHAATVSEDGRRWLANPTRVGASLHTHNDGVPHPLPRSWAGFRNDCDQHCSPFRGELVCFRILNFQDPS